VASLLLASGLAVPTTAAGQEQTTRKLKTQVNPVYPDLARRMNIAGVVKVEVTIAPNGSVRTAKLVGGHPVLANAAMDSVKRWRYEPSSSETTTVVEFHFDPKE
jgi:TonB family protein